MLLAEFKAGQEIRVKQPVLSKALEANEHFCSTYSWHCSVWVTDGKRGNAHVHPPPQELGAPPTLVS